MSDYGMSEKVAVVAKESFSTNYDVDFYRHLEDIRGGYDIVFEIIDDMKVSVIVHYQKGEYLPAKNDNIRVMNAKDFIIGILATIFDTEDAGIDFKDISMFFANTTSGDFITYPYETYNLNDVAYRIVSECRAKMSAAKKVFVLFVGEGSAFEFSDALDTILGSTGKNQRNSMYNFVNMKVDRNKVFLYMLY